MVSRFIKYYSLPLLVVLVASIQLYRTETTQQSRWKGGGFGMYTSINESHGFVLVNKVKFAPEMLTNADLSKKYSLRNNLLFYPSDSHAKLFYSHLIAKEKTTLIEVYQPEVNIKTKTLVFRQVYEHSFKKN